MSDADRHDAVPSQPVALKKYRAGTHRLVAPGETLDRIGRFFPAMGITRVADVTGLDTIGIPVVLVYRPNSRSLVVAQGKGLDLIAAKASGVMESVEAYMAERIVQPLVLGSFNDLQFSHPLVDIAAVPRTTTSLYHPDLPILWIEGEELFTRMPMWIPHEMVHTAHTLPAPTGTGCFIGTTTGLASGNHFLEALSHALCEVVERDAATLHRLRTAAEVALRRIDPQTVDDPDCLQALGHLDQAGLDAGIWDVTTDVAIPTFRCVIAERNHAAIRLMYGAQGMGCHPDRGIALLRAITEAAQTRLTLISGARDNATQREYSLAMEPDLWRRQHAALAAEVCRDFRTVPTFDSDSFDADVTWELEALRSAGIRQVIAVDLSREEFGVPVVRVIVPGLEGPVELIPSCLPGRRAVDLAASQ